MPGKVDEPKWDDAKAAAKKQYPDLDEKNPRFWKIVSTIYKKMGGKFSKKMEKSMAAVDAAVRMTPSFIENPRIWLAAIKKSCGSLRMKIEDTNAVVAEYYSMGGGLLKSSMLETSFEDGIAKSIAGQFVGQAEAPGDLEKAAGGVHKYANRVPKPGGGFRYIYPGGEGAAKPAAPAAKPAPAASKPPEPKKVKTSMASIVDSLSKKTAQAQRASLQNVSDDALTGMQSHADAKGHKGLAAVIHQEKEARKVKQATQKKTEKSQNDPAFESFCETYREDIKKSLAESHPGWDAETLESRLEPQLRQMFRLHQD